MTERLTDQQLQDRLDAGEIRVPPFTYWRHPDHPRRYFVTGLRLREEDLAVLVDYHAIDGLRLPWSRPLDLFLARFKQETAP